MRLFIVTFLSLSILLISNPSYAQKQYPSLLWKIEGNGLKKTSYLYGTMHVSSKIAFNLGDEFFEALASTEAVALESNPENWLDFYRESGLSQASEHVLGNQSEYSSGKGFYKRFLTIPEYRLELFQSLLAPQDRILNQLLYRYNFGQENYEETTYLDMFIFQSAKKNEKPIFSLENIQESFFLSEYSNLPDEDDDLSGSGRFRSFGRASDLEKYYLERNLDALDSLITKDFSKNYRKYLLTIRNDNMVVAMDSIMPKKSLFAGVGAAHLAGEDGMIEMLRRKGYTVSPVDFKRSKKANKTFRKLAEANTDLTTEKHVSKDGRISLEAVGKFYDENENQASYLIQSYFCPDYANGAYFGYERMKRVAFGKDFFSKSNLNYIDSVLYLITPGDITKQKKTTVGKYNAIEVSSKLQRGSYYRALIIETPEEIIVVKSGGNKSFISSKNVKNFFSSVKILQPDNNKKINDRGITVEFPSTPVLHGNESGVMHVTSVDQQRNYYTLDMRYLKDFSELEEDEFELNYLVEEFAEELEAEVVDQTISDKTITATIKKDNKEFHIYYEIYHNFYYRLTSFAPKEEALRYFKSFKRSTPNYVKNSFVEKTDTMLNYTVTTFAKDELNMELVASFKDLKTEFQRVESKKDSLNEDFGSEQIKRIYEDPVTGEAIQVSHYKPNDYFSFKDGFTSMRDYALLKYSSDSLYYHVHFLHEDTTEHGVIMEYNYSKDGTTRVLKNKAILSQNRIITLTVNYDSTLTVSPFIDKFFRTFTPVILKDSTIRLTAEHKGKQWIKDIKSDEYQRYTQAQKSISEVIFEHDDRSDLEYLLMNDSLKNIDASLRGDLLYEYRILCKEDPNYFDFVATFLEKYDHNNALHIRALGQLSNLGNQEATNKFIDLLIAHPPIINESSDLRFLLGIYTDSIHLFAPRIKDIAQFGLDYDEFLPRIIYLFDRGIYKDAFSINDIPSNFLDELHKRGMKHLRKFSYFAEESKIKYAQVRTELTEIASLLYSDPNSLTAYPRFFQQLDTISDERFKSNLLAKRINRKNPYTSDEVRSVIEDTSYVYPFFEWISGSGVTDSIFNAFEISKELLYQSYIMRNGGYNADKDTLVFIKKEHVSTFGKEGYAYIFKATNDNNRQRLRAVYFVDDDSKKIHLEPLSIETLSIDKDDDIDEEIEKLLKRIAHTNRTRVTSGSQYDFLY